MTADQRAAERQEALWSGEFGDRYLERNRGAGGAREPFWRALHTAHPFDSVLEVGCGNGANLRWLAGLVAPSRVYGIDINAQAVRELRGALPDVNAVEGPAADLPFRDGVVELAFTAALLIHQPPDVLPTVMREVVRCSRRYVLCGEYHADGVEEVPYRGHRDVLFKRDWGALYQELFPELRLLERSFQSRENSGWDDVTFWLFEKP
jgi:spore coat polysaccharide biosynthesis protein SpsF